MLTKHHHLFHHFEKQKFMTKLPQLGSETEQIYFEGDDASANNFSLFLLQSVLLFTTEIW